MTASEDTNINSAANHGVTKPAAAKGKVEAKFRDAATGATWTGRGKTPRWLVDAEANGRSREEFRIVAEVAAA